MAGTLENRGKGAWRIGTQVKDDFGVWHWVRETIHVDPSLSIAQQRKKAAAQLAKLLVAVESGGMNPANTHTTLSEFAQVYLDKHCKPNLSPTTYSTYANLIATRILPTLGDTQLAKLTPATIDSWVNVLRASPRKTTRKTDAELKRKRTPSDAGKLSEPATLSERTVQHCFDMLNNMLETAVKWDYIQVNPMQKATRPKVRKDHVACMSEERANNLVRLCLEEEPNRCYRIALILALLCGLRLGEVGALKLSDVDFVDATIDITRARKYTSETGTFVGHTKAAASDRLIALPQLALDELDAERIYQETAPDIYGDAWHGDGTIVHTYDGKPMSHDAPSKWFRRFADAHGYEDITFHDLRHTHASLLLANGIDVVAVAARMGHSDTATTLRTYAHALRRRDTDAANVFDTIIRPTDPQTDQ